MDLSLAYIEKHKHWIIATLTALLTLLTYNTLAFYIRFDFNLVLLLLVLPFVIRKQSNNKSIRYGIVALCLLTLYPILNLSSIYFFGTFFTLIFLYESLYGKLSVIPVILLIVVSPVAIFLTEVVGFEIRLWLTKIASKILFVYDNSTSYLGNIILLKNEAFHVDSECLGLKMVTLSLFIGLLFITFQEHKTKLRYSLWSILAIISTSYILVIVANLFRIIIIVVFKSYPGSLSHEVIGILSFIFYVLAPLWYVVKFFPKKEPSESTQNKSKNINIKFNAILLLLLFGTFGTFNLLHFEKSKTDAVNSNALTIDTSAYSCSIEEHGVLKLNSDRLLIYIKPGAHFYSADHSPLICWKGSGYTINKEEILNLRDKKVYFTELRQNSDILYATWWYDCGDDKSISQFRWRTRNLIYGKEYKLVNIVSDDKDTLIKETNKMLSSTIFN